MTSGSSGRNSRKLARQADRLGAQILADELRRPSSPRSLR